MRRSSYCQGAIAITGEYREAYNLFFYIRKESNSCLYGLTLLIKCFFRGGSSKDGGEAALGNKLYFSGPLIDDVSNDVERLVDDLWVTFAWLLNDWQSGPAGPADPTDPTDPTDPADPADSSDTTDPADLAGPADPDDPSESHRFR